MKRLFTTAFLATVLFAPQAVHAGIILTCVPGATNPFSPVRSPTVVVCANGVLFTYTGFIGGGKPFTLPSVTQTLVNGASFTLSASVNADPFSNFAFSSFVPSGIGSFTFDAYFMTPVVGGPYNRATSNGTLQITATGVNAVGTVNNDGYPAFVSGYGDATSLGVNAGTFATNACTSMGVCIFPGVAATLAPISPTTLAARLNYTQGTSGVGSSTASWTAGVTLTSTSIVPEPATLGLVFAGIVAIGGVMFRRNSA